MPSTTLRVLILEDNESDTRLLLRSLRSCGFEVVPQVVSSEADYRAELGGSYDVVLAGYSLQGFDALTALDILAASGHDLPFIVVAGSAEEDAVVECIRRGASDFLHKERLARLGGAIRQALRSREVRAEERRTLRELELAHESAQQDYARLLERLGVLAEQVGVAQDERQVYRALFEFSLQSTPAAGICVTSLDPQTDEGRCAYAAWWGGESIEEGEISPHSVTSLPHGPRRAAVKSGEPVLSEYEVGLPAGVRPPSLGDRADQGPVRSALAVPLRVMGRTIGVFEVQSPEPAAFGEEHSRSLAMAANYAAVALEKVGLLAAERDLRRSAEESERRYRELVEQASDAIVVFDEGGALLQANSMAFRMLGEQPQPVSERNVRDWFAPQELEARPLRFDALAVGESVRSERQFRRSDGTLVPVEINTRRLAPRTYQAIVRDISERKAVEEALLNEKRFSDSVINSLPGIFYLFDEKLRLLRWNSNLTTVTGYSEGEVASMSPLEFFASEQREQLLERVAAVLDEGTGTTQADIVTKAGESVPYFFSSHSLVLEGRAFVVGMGLDISQQRHSEAREKELNFELEKRLRRLSALHDIDMAITGSVDLRLTLNVVIDKVIGELDVDGCSIWLYERGNQSFRCIVSKGLPEGSLRRGEVRLGQSPIGRCGLERALLRLTGEELGHQLPQIGAGISDYLALPLISKGQLQGVLEVSSSAERPLDEDRLEFLEALGLQTAIAIDNVTMFEGLERSTVELTLAYDSTIEGWARALDLRDHETEGHSRRVTELTIRLARHMGVGESELAHIRRGSLLHDIGKLGVPDAILTKPAGLSEEERLMMQRHARLGYELLAPITFLRPAVDIPYCHHELWDGSGYPRGLRGEEIPLAARIFTVADVFDALTSNRPYRRAWSRADALAYLRERSGKKFDPRVVSAFLEIEPLGEDDLDLHRETPDREAADRVAQG